MIKFCHCSENQVSIYWHIDFPSIVVTSVPAIVALATIICWKLVMAPKSVTFRRHDHLVSVLFGDLLKF